RVVGQEALVRRRARPEREIRLDARGELRDVERREQVREPLRVIRRRVAKQREPPACRVAQAAPLQRLVELGASALELTQREVEPPPPFAERGLRLGEKPRDAADAREIDAAAGAAVTVLGLVERSVAAGAGERDGSRHAGTLGAEAAPFFRTTTVRVKEIRGQSPILTGQNRVRHHFPWKWCLTRWAAKRSCRSRSPRTRSSDRGSWCCRGRGSGSATRTDAARRAAPCSSARPSRRAGSRCSRPASSSAAR